MPDQHLISFEIHYIHEANLMQVRDIISEDFSKKQQDEIKKEWLKWRKKIIDIIQSDEGWMEKGRLSRS